MYKISNTDCRTEKITLINTIFTENRTWWKFYSLIMHLSITIRWNKQSYSKIIGKIIKKSGKKLEQSVIHKRNLSKFVIHG